MTERHSSPDPPARTAPGGARRRRGQALEQALLEAAWQELLASGYAHLTMERVALRAGTSRAVIHRRWRSRADLVIAALRHRRPVSSGSIPDSGSLREDVVELMRLGSARVSAFGPETLVGLLADLLADEQAYAATISELVGSGTELMQEILTRAATRGEARSDVPPRVARLPLDLLRHELILTHRPPTDEAIAEIVDELFLPLVAPRSEAGVVPKSAHPRLP